METHRRESSTPTLVLKDRDAQCAQLPKDPQIQHHQQLPASERRDYKDAASSHARPPPEYSESSQRTTRPSPHHDRDCPLYRTNGRIHDFDKEKSVGKPRTTTTVELVRQSLPLSAIGQNPCRCGNGRASRHPLDSNNSPSGDEDGGNYALRNTPLSNISDFDLDRPISTAELAKYREKREKSGIFPRLWPENQPKADTRRK